MFAMPGQHSPWIPENISPTEISQAFIFLSTDHWGKACIPTFIFPKLPKNLNDVKPIADHQYFYIKSLDCMILIWYNLSSDSDE